MIPHPSPEPDDQWFLDHGRRSFRLRAAAPGEYPVDVPLALLIRRTALKLQRLLIDVSSQPEWQSTWGFDEACCEAMWKCAESAGITFVPDEKRPGASRGTGPGGAEVGGERHPATHNPSFLERLLGVLSGFPERKNGGELAAHRRP